jgi:hypothetical protein
MMGRQQRVQKKLFYTKFSLDQRVPKNHILRFVIWGRTTLSA